MLWQYEVFGHSGEGYSFPFVNSESPPKNMKDRLDVLLASKLFASVLLLLFICYMTTALFAAWLRGILCP